MAKRKVEGNVIIKLAVPVAREVVGNVPHKIDAQLYSAEARRGLAVLRQGLEAAAEKRFDGAAIESNADAVRWLLERLGADAEAGEDS